MGWVLGSISHLLSRLVSARMMREREENIRYECKRLQNVSNAKGDEKQQQKYTTEHSQQKIHVQIAKSKAMRESGNWTIEIH